MYRCLLYSNTTIHTTIHIIIQFLCNKNSPIKLRNNKSDINLIDAVIHIFSYVEINKTRQTYALRGQYSNSVILQYLYPA
jgi:hypothetical protein